MDALTVAAARGRHAVDAAVRPLAHGPDDILAWWVGPGHGCRGSRLVPVIAANGAPAFGQYKPREAGEGVRAVVAPGDPARGGRIVEFTFFLDTERVFPLFGLPLDYESLAVMPRG